ncbi:STM3941 family protein [Flavobacterium sp. CFBP9031]|uniref:STM3941 family protein n=1 Tax=Flavobacterium sp. CFBP9031 TaxID=3096538 RepID=UPI002A69D886|nr:STM3941 family protein [Flavobacterium sp. CFBP9031]MDY0988921.1 STM3941 family protein [Flavobacterium sp. CFBP9031]
MERIEIYSSRKKTSLLLIIGALFTALGFELFINAEHYLSYKFKSLMFIKGIGIILILFCGLGVYIAIRQLIKNKLFLIIDKSGINVNPEKNSSEFIKWNNIEGFSELKIQSQKMVLIKINNPDYWIENKKNLILKKLTQFNFTNYGSPFCLSAVSMQINHAELMKVLNQNLKKYKN